MLWPHAAPQINFDSLPFSKTKMIKLETLWKHKGNLHLIVQVALSRLPVPAFCTMAGLKFTVQSWVSWSDEVLLTLGFFAALAFGFAAAFAPEVWSVAFAFFRRALFGLSSYQCRRPPPHQPSRQCFGWHKDCSCRGWAWIWLRLTARILFHSDWCQWQDIAKSINSDKDQHRRADEKLQASCLWCKQNQAQTNGSPDPAFGKHWECHSAPFWYKTCQRRAIIDLLSCWVMFAVAHWSGTPTNPNE